MGHLCSDCADNCPNRILQGWRSNYNGFILVINIFDLISNGINYANFCWIIKARTWNGDMEKEIDHRDLLGQALQVGDYVVTNCKWQNKSLLFGRVGKITPKMLRVESNDKSTLRRYPREVVKVDGPYVMAHVLKGDW